VMLEGRGGPTGTALLLRWQRAPPSPRGPQSRRWGGCLAGICHPAHVGTVGLPPPGLYLSVRRDFRPGLSSASRGSGLAKLMATLRPRPTGVHRYTCVACMGQFDLVLSHWSKGTRSQGGGPQVGRKVVRACSEPQSMFLHFETRRSGHLTNQPVSYPAFCYLIGRPGRCLFARPLGLGSLGNCLCGGKTPQGEAAPRKV